MPHVLMRMYVKHREVPGQAAAMHREGTAWCIRQTYRIGRIIATQDTLVAKVDLDVSILVRMREAQSGSYRTIGHIFLIHMLSGISLPNASYVICP